MRFLFLIVFIFSTQAFANKITWLGQATTLIETSEGKKILIDPFIFNNPKTPKKFKQESFYENIDLILITHGHWDHLGSYSKIMKLSPKSMISMNADMANILMTKGELDKKRYIPLNKSGKFNPFKKDNVEVNMVRAEHSSSLKIGDDIHYGGEPVGYVVRFSNGKTLYHAGDTGVFGDMKMIDEYYKIDLALLPIGGSYTMGPKEAAYAINEYLKPKQILPIHYGTFPALKGTPAQLKKHLKKKKRMLNVAPGESVTL